MIDITNTTALLSNFSIEEAVITIKPALVFIVAMVLYSIFIFKFYKFIAKRDILKSKEEEPEPFFIEFFNVIYKFIRYIIAFPVFTFFWFIVITILLSFLAREQTIQSILLVSVAIIAAIRITAYYNEDLSKDLAKMLPFALLGITVIDISYFSVSDALTILNQLPSLWKVIVYYLVFIVILESILRIVYGIYSLFSNKE